MTVVKIMGGLGNQMFQYALYKNLELKKYKVYAEIECLDHNGFELFKIFNININIADKKIIKKYDYIQHSIVNKILVKVLGYKKNNYIESNHEYVDNLDIFKDKKIIGFWQNLNYLNGIEDEIIKCFKFPEIQDEYNLSLKDDIENNNSVSIHIRLGDYMMNDVNKNRYYVCTPEYYEKSIKYIKKVVKNPKFYIFSNDIELAKNNIKILNDIDCVYINKNSGENSYKDMQLMSMCKHNIIANSTFSWWGAYLNKNVNKYVICPKKWFANEDEDKMNLYKEEWIKI